MSLPNKIPGVELEVNFMIERQFRYKYEEGKETGTEGSSTFLTKFVQIQSRPRLPPQVPVKGFDCY